MKVKVFHKDATLFYDRFTADRLRALFVSLRTRFFKPTPPGETTQWTASPGNYMIKELHDRQISADDIGLLGFSKPNSTIKLDGSTWG